MSTIKTKDNSKKDKKVKNPRLGVIEKNNNIKSSALIPFILFIVSYGILYFILKDKLPFTPDFISSDVFHLNVSFKYYLWQSIRSGVLPFWTDRLAGGFPLIAETQIGAFFFPHFLIFPFFSNFSHAYIFLFTFHLFLLSAGMYLLLKLLKVPSILSFLLALTFTWCGAISFRWVHFNLLQVFSLCPFLFCAYLKWNNTQKKRYALFIPFLICQMIFAGHMQTTFNVLLGLIFTHLLLNYPFKWRKNIIFFLLVLFGFMLATPQILPTILFLQYSTRGVMNTYQYVVQYIYNTQDLIGFISANVLGSPQNASYAGLGNAANRIYWENTPYLGELFILTLVLSSIYYFVNYKKRPFVRIFLILFFIFLLLAFGGDSPLYFLFGMFPFNMFRTPAKYLLEAVFFLILYTALILREIIKKHQIFLWFVYSALVVNCYILIQTAFNYHLFINQQKLFNSLNVMSHISSQSSYLTFGGDEMWAKKFQSNGWKIKNNIDDYLFMNSALFPNSNLLIGLSSFDINTGGLKMRRSEYIISAINDSLTEFTHKNNNGNIIAKFENFLQLYNIGTIVSFQPLYLSHFVPIQSKKKGDVTITAYNYQSKNALFYIPKNVRSFSYFEDIEKEIVQETVSEDNSFAESLPELVKQDIHDLTIKTVTNSDGYFKCRVDSNKKKFIAVKKGWYPEWKLFIDGKEQKIYKTNLIHMGFFIPKGSHRIELIYVPMSFYLGCIISSITFIGMVIYLLKTIQGRK